jgi:uncharacterized RDD family membrane protein YckC
MEKKDFAGFWVRFFASLLDTAFLLPFLVILVHIFSVNEYQMIKIDDAFHSYSYLGASSTNRFIDILTYAISIAYLGYFLTTKKQATLGKRILGIYVGNPDGSKLTPQKSVARALASILTAAVTLGLGFLLIIFTKEKTALHDIICNTRVFHGKKS